VRDSGGGGGVVGLIVAETGRGVLEIDHRAAMMTHMLWLLLKGNLEPGRSKMREDLEQELVRNHRHRRALIDQRSNHRHRRDGLLHP